LLSRVQVNYLVGVGASWHVPGFKYFNTNVYAANNGNIENDTQLTVTWGYPINVSKHNIIFDGYLDWSSAESDHKADFHFNPQLRVDVGHYFDNPNVIEMGIEYSYWHNKFGITGLDNESVVSALVKVYL